MEPTSTPSCPRARVRKTTVLAERYVRLVTERGLDVDSILTLTFSRKAAAEMYARIYAKLSESDHPRARAQLAAFDTARIMTLDAFCANVARGACHRYGVPPDFIVDEARLQRIADEAAVEVLMDRRKRTRSAAWWRRAALTESARTFWWI
jgi:ATP-dependent helicase/nuclease subunit A